MRSERLIGMLVLLMLLALLCSLAVPRLTFKMQVRGRALQRRFAGAAFVAVFELLLLTMALSGMPLPLFYLLLYPACCLVLPFARNGKAAWYGGNLWVISFCSVHLSALGVISLVSGASPYAVLGQRPLRMLSLAIALFMTGAGAVVLLSPPLWKRMKILTTCKGEFHLLLKFTWFGAGYILFDSISCLFSLPHALTSWFLIGSSLILFLQMCFFSSHVYSIAENDYLEEEHYQLERSRREQTLRTISLQKTAYRDGLTGAYTRRYAKKEMTIMLREEQLFSVVFVDLDSLKEINDTLGHLSGDQYLIGFSRFFMENLRKGDLFARIGGDEFLILLPGCAQEEAAEIASGVREALLHCGHFDRPVSFSFGTAQSAPGKQADELITEADLRMYRDKENRKKGARTGE